MLISLSLVETTIVLGLASVIACVIAALAGLLRSATSRSKRINITWLLRIGIYAGVPFSIMGMTSGYLTGSSRVGAISALVPAGLTLVGGVAVYMFGKGAKAALMAVFAVVNFSTATMVGTIIGGREREQTDQIRNSLDYKEAEIEKEFLLQRYRKGLGMDMPKAPESDHKSTQADQ